LLYIFIPFLHNCLQYFVTKTIIINASFKVENLRVKQIMSSTLGPVAYEIKHGHLLPTHFAVSLESLMLTNSRLHRV